MTMYDYLLCYYLFKKYHIQGLLLDIGCGDGKHVDCFKILGIDARGIDRQDCNLETDGIEASNIDFVFCKSVIEHIHNTEHLLSETYRVLKPRGIAIFMTPDISTDYKCFWDDPTHVNPFTRKGLQDAFKFAGFVDVECKGFWQLPWLWRYPFLEPLRWTISLLPDRFKWKDKEQLNQRVIVRHSKERMLLVVARKPTPVDIIKQSIDYVKNHEEIRWSKQH